jgi:hypothetical protein
MRALKLGILLAVAVAAAASIAHPCANIRATVYG